jgi:phosphatidylserine synthase
MSARGTRRQLAPRTPDEWIALARLLLAFLLWIPALLRRPRLVAAGVVLSGISDMADGFVSRLRGSRSGYSRQLDTIADSAVMLSTLGCLPLCRPGSLKPLRGTVLTIAAVATALLAIQWRRYRMIGALHIDTTRAAAVVGHLYVLNLLWRNASSRVLLSIFQLLAAAGMVESAWAILGPYDPESRSPRPLLQYVTRIARR